MVDDQEKQDEDRGAVHKPPHFDFSRVDKKTRFTVSGAVIGIVVFLIGYLGHGWLETHLDLYLMSEAEAGELTDELSKVSKAASDAAAAAEVAATVATETSTRLYLFIEAQELKEQREQLAGLEDQLSETLLWESENGQNSVSQARKDDLQRRIEARQDYIECLASDRDNCTL